MIPAKTEAKTHSEDVKATLNELADPTGVPPDVDEQLELALHLTSGCAECWRILDAGSFPEPHTSDEPIVRAVRRAACPTWGFYLWSRHLQLVRQLEPGVGFAFLVAEEAIDLALRRRETNEVYFDGCLRSDYLDVAKRLATELAAAQPRFQPAREILARLDAARAACAPAHTARAAAESAHDHHERILFRGSPETKIDLALADLHVVHAEHFLTEYPEGAPVKAPLWVGSAEYCRARDLLDRHDPHNPVRYFEILYEGRVRHDGTSGLQLLEALAGTEGHPDVLYRLNGLFQKARLVAGLRSLVGDDGCQLLAADVVADLVKARGLVETYGDTQSQALYHQYLGDLLAPDDAPEALIAYGRALEIFGGLRWFRDRLEPRIGHIPQSRYTGWYQRAVKLSAEHGSSRRRLPSARAVVGCVDEGLATVSRALEDWTEIVAPGAPRELSAEFYLTINRLREVAAQLARALHRQGWLTRPRKEVLAAAPGKERGP